MKKIILIISIIPILILAGCNSNSSPIDNGTSNADSRVLTQPQNHIDVSESSVAPCKKMVEIYDEYKNECDVIRKNGGTGYSDMTSNLEEFDPICKSNNELTSKQIQEITVFIENMEAQMIACSFMNED